METNATITDVTPFDDVTDVVDYDDGVVGIALKALVVLSALGLVGNILTLVRLTRSEEMSSGTRTYHVVVAIVDILVLLLSLPRFWFVALSMRDMYSASTVCQLFPWMEFGVLSMQLWLYVAMAAQILEGIKLFHEPGGNITRWKSRVYTGFVFFIALLANAHLLLFVGGPKTAGSGGGSGSGGGDVSNITTTMSPVLHAQCQPKFEWYATFLYEAWPWISLSGALGIPLVVLTVLNVMTMRLLVLRCRQADHSPLRSPFVTFVTSVLLLSTVTFLMSVPLCAIAYSDARKYWTDYPNTFIIPHARQGHFTLWRIFRALFYFQFAVRWIVTCFCFKLWPNVRCLCRKR